MIIQCTKGLLDKLNLQKDEVVPPDVYGDTTDSLYAWHANLVTIDRRKAIVFMNNLTRYVIVLYRPKAKDYTKISEKLKEGIKAAFTSEGIRTEIIEEYLERLGDNKFSKTSNRSMVAKLNKVIEQVGWYSDELREESLIQPRFSLRMGRTLANYNGTYELPSERMARALCVMTNRNEDEWLNIYSIENYQLMIRMDFDNFDIWRRIQIPSNATFEVLHHVIQQVFGWHNYHLHEFLVMDENPVKIRIVDGKDPESSDYLEPDQYEVRYDTETELKDILNEHEKCIYTYDFGDNWRHTIKLEKVLKEQTNQFPILLERKGERPPEDVGGEDGFEEYMRIISDPSNEEYESIMQWAKLTKERERTIEEINRALRFFRA